MGVLAAILLSIVAFLYQQLIQTVIFVFHLWEGDSLKTSGDLNLQYRLSSHKDPMKAETTPLQALLSLFP